MSIERLVLNPVKSREVMNRRIIRPQNVVTEGLYDLQDMIKLTSIKIPGKSHYYTFTWNTTAISLVLY